MSLVVPLLRAKDLLHVELELINLVLDSSDPGHPRLTREADGPASIVMRLPPQHIAEEAFLPDDLRKTPYKAVLACPSRIVVSIPNTVVDIPFSIEELLKVLRSVPVTVDSRTSGEPTTVLDFPEGLLLVPESGTRLDHRVTPVTSPTQPSRTELWHARLMTGPSDAAATPRFRALPTDQEDTERFPTARTSLHKRHRDEIRKHSSREPLIAASEFVLTPLGASAQLRSAWVPDFQTTLVAWDHKTCLGRDTRVETVEEGFLFPWGHRVSQVTITERTISNASVGELIQEQFFTVHEQEKSYTDVVSAYPHDGREMPFTNVYLVLPPDGRLMADKPINARLLDARGNFVGCSLPALFASRAVVTNQAELVALAGLFKQRNAVQCGNQPISLAAEDSGSSDTTVNIEGLRFDVLLDRPVHPPFLPVFESADVRIPAVEQLLGTVGGAPNPQTMKFDETYLNNNFGPGNAKQVFARFEKELPEISIPSERAGGLAAPKFQSLNALSLNGPIADHDNLPASKLVGSAKLFGMIALADLLPSQIGADADEFKGVPAAELYERVDTEPDVFVTRPVISTVRADARVETRFIWKPKIPGRELPPLLRPAQPAPGEKEKPIVLILKGRINKILGASDSPSFEVNGKLSNFGLKFKEFLAIDFDGVEFISVDGGKMDVKVHIRDFTFLGALKFVQNLQKALPRETFGAGPIIEPLPNGVRVGYSIPIPALPLGVFNLQNVAVSISASLPFSEGTPAAVRFALSERHQPFLVSASIFGGTGFFAMEVRTDDSVHIEAAIEFGGVVAFNVFIARGAVYAFVGIYVSVDPGKLLINGHVRVGGQVEVLGLVSVSIEVYIALEYDGQVLAGEARVTVSVKLAFFSESVSFSVRKEISGFGEKTTEFPQPVALGRIGSPPVRSADPTRRIRAMDAESWKSYCAAFA